MAYGYLAGSAAGVASATLLWLRNPQGNSRVVQQVIEYG